MTSFLMVQDPPGKPPAPAVRVQTAREVFRRRFGREPARVLTHPAETTAGAEAREGVGPGVCWVGPVEGGEG